MASLTQPQIENALKSLRLDLVTAKTTRPDENFEFQVNKLCRIVANLPEHHNEDACKAISGALGLKKKIEITRETVDDVKEKLGALLRKRYPDKPDPLALFLHDFTHRSELGENHPLKTYKKSKKPHELIIEAVTKEVTRKIQTFDLPPERLDAVVANELDKWNNYLIFAFDQKKSTFEFYKAHERDIKDIVDSCQKGALKGQLDRQLVWRYKQTPPTIMVRRQTVPNPLAAAYQDMAIAHNAAFIIGTIGKVLSLPAIKTDLDAADFAADAIETIKSRMELYDPSQTAWSSFMTRPVQWAIFKLLTGKAQDKFDREMLDGLLHKQESEEAVGVEAIAPRLRDETDGFAFAAQDTRKIVSRRLYAAARKLDGEHHRAMFDYKMKHPDATLKEIGKNCGLTNERARQILNDIGAQIMRIDPELAHYTKAMIVRDEGEMDAERLSLEYEDSPLKKRLHSLIVKVRRDIAGMRDELGAGNVLERDGTLLISREATRGNKSLKAIAKNLTATHEAMKIMQEIVDSPFKDAGLDILTIKQVQRLAFYPGGSAELEAFVENNIEALASACRDKIIAENTKHPGKIEKINKLVDRFYASTHGELAKFLKSEINALFSAPKSNSGEVLDADDLRIVRQMGVALMKREALEIT